MFKKLSIAVCLLLLVLTTLTVSPAMAEEEKVLNIYFWYDYLLDSTVKDFEKETGIKVHLDTFENISIMETKLLAGKSGYDIVIPVTSMMERMIKLNSFKKLDKSKISTWGNLDPKILSNLAQVDKNNTYGVPYGWGTTVIAFNVDMVKKRLPNADLRSWDLFFKPENISKLSDCGVAVLDSYSEIIPIALNYLGLKHNSVKKADLKKAEKLLMSVRPYIRHFNTGSFIEELATGELCVAITYNGDAGMSAMRAEELKNNVVIDYSIPNEGTIVYFDLLTIPIDAKHPDNAHKFFDFLNRPKEMAKLTNEIWFASGNSASLAYVNDEVKGDPDIYPPDEVMEKLFLQASLPKKDRRTYTRLWTKIKAVK